MFFKACLYFEALFNLLSVGASFSQTGSTSSWLAEHDIAVSAQDNCLRVAKNSRNLKASRALNIHKERVWALHKTLKFVGSEFQLWGGVQQISWHCGGSKVKC
jgi:hypothetical protein